MSLAPNQMLDRSERMRQRPGYHPGASVTQKNVTDGVYGGELRDCIAQTPRFGARRQQRQVSPKRRPRHGAA